VTLQQGGGVGTDFSPLRPKGAKTDATGGRSSGPVSFMQMWEQMCATVTDTSPRRGAMMGVMACDHPDIHAFVAAKRVAGKLTHFNVSGARSTTRSCARSPTTGRGSSRSRASGSSARFARASCGS
jgi:ribonucleotide reductase alpha subunit